MRHYLHYKLIKKVKVSYNFNIIIDKKNRKFTFVLMFGRNFNGFKDFLE
jgi:hypothetical protein